jgi:hypothetical protein
VYRMNQLQDSLIRVRALGDDTISTGSIRRVAELTVSKVTESIISVRSVRHELQCKFAIRTINHSLDFRHRVHPPSQ